jgi:S-disulfanyl-L-cysteine oxidoreductase SoxD
MENCKDSVEITAHATVLDVTPDVTEGEEAAVIELVAAEGEVAATEAVAEAAPEPAPESVVAAADPALIAEGEKVFKKCSACHKVGEGARNGTGPQLNGIVGRAAGTVEGFKYSKPLTEMAAAGLVWDEPSMQAYIENPKGFMKGTRMAFAGLKKPEDRDAVIAYLATFGE